MEDFKEVLENLLAIIHRDGGQHTIEVGIEKSVEDAIQIILKYHHGQNNMMRLKEDEEAATERSGKKG